MVIKPPQSFFVIFGIILFAFQHLKQGLVLKLFSNADVLLMSHIVSGCVDN